MDSEQNVVPNLTCCIDDGETGIPILAYIQLCGRHGDLTCPYPHGYP